MVGLITLFFGIYTERKSLALAFKQTVAAASSAGGAGMGLLSERVYRSYDGGAVDCATDGPWGSELSWESPESDTIFIRDGCTSRVPVGSSWDYHKGQR